MILKFIFYLTVMTMLTIFLGRAGLFWGLMMVGTFLVLEAVEMILHGKIPSQEEIEELEAVDQEQVINELDSEDSKDDLKKIFNIKVVLVSQKILGNYNGFPIHDFIVIESGEFMEYVGIAPLDGTPVFLQEDEVVLTSGLRYKTIPGKTIENTIIAINGQ